MIDESGPEKSPSGRTHPPDVGANRRLDASLDARSFRSFVRSFGGVRTVRTSRAFVSRSFVARDARRRRARVIDFQAAAATGPRSLFRRAGVARDERRG